MTTIADLSVKIGADISNLQSNLNNADGQVKNFGDRASAAAGVAKNALLGIAGAATAIGGASLVAAMNFESSFANVVKTVDGTETQLDALKESIRTMATVGDLSALDNAHESLTNIAAIAGQLGVPTDDIQEFTRVVGGMTVATDLSAESAATFAARFANVTGMDIGNIGNLADAIVTLGNNSAAQESEITAVANRLASLSGLNFEVDEILGYSAAIASLGLSPELGASNMIKTVTEMTSAFAAGGPKAEAFAKAMGMSVAEATALQQTDPAATFDALLASLNNMSADEALNTLNALGISSQEQQRTILTLAQGYDTVTASVDTASEAYEGNNALADEVAAKAATTQGKLNTLKNNVTDLAIEIGEVLLPAASKMAQGFTKMFQGIKAGDAVTALAGIGEAVQPIFELFGGDSSADLGAGLASWVGAIQNFKQIVTIVIDDISRRFRILSLDIQLMAADMMVAVQRAIPEPLRDNDALLNAETTAVTLGSERQGYETVDRINDAIRAALQSGEKITLDELVDMGEGLTIPLENLLPAITDDNASELFRKNLSDLFLSALDAGDAETTGGLLPFADMMSIDPEVMRTKVVDAAAAAFGEDGEMLDVVMDTAAEFDVDPNTDKFRDDVTAAIEARKYPVTVEAPVTVKAVITGVVGLMNGSSASPSVDGVEKYHSGGTFRSSSGEGLAMLRDGERVLTPGQASGYGGGGQTVIQYASFGETPYNALRKLQAAASDAGY